MNILFVVTYVPSVVRTRSYNLIRQLTARGHRVTLATVWSSDRERGELEAVKRICHQVHAVQVSKWQSLLNCVRVLPGTEPLQAAYSWSPELKSLIDTLLPDADVVHVEHLRGARYARHCLSSLRNSPVPVVWDSVDCISYLFEQAARSRHDRAGRLVNMFELPRTRRHEGSLWREFDHVVISSDADKAAIMALGTGAERAVSVLPNGVDVDFFSPRHEPREPRTLIFSGKMSYHANVSAVTYLLTDIMPIVWRSLPDTRLLIVGKDPPRSLQTLAARYGSRVTVTGTVDDVRPYLCRATAAVVPLVYGAGSQFKVLEAMGCATPVVATPRAVAALATVPGRDVLVAEDPVAFGRAVVNLLGNQEAQREIGAAGRRYVEKHHRWDQIAGHLEGIYREAVAQRRPQPTRASA
jgi:glycosyltransferase involved in cell wall biosynthesis